LNTPKTWLSKASKIQRAFFCCSLSTRKETQKERKICQKLKKFQGRLSGDQARRQNLAAAGGQKPEGGAKNQKGEHFKNTVLDVCSNRWAKGEMGGAPILNGGPGTTGPLSSDGPDGDDICLNFFWKNSIKLINFKVLGLCLELNFKSRSWSQFY